MVSRGSGEDGGFVRDPNAGNASCVRVPAPGAGPSLFGERGEAGGSL